MSFETITLETDARGVATLTLNQPDKHNALSARMIEELSAVTGKINANKNIRVVILTGAGESFCAGGDLGWMRQQFEADRETRIAEAMKLARMLRGLNELSKPMIGRIQGQAFGGGIGMMSVCDVSVGSRPGRFALTETKLGLIPATISPYVVARMGEGRARRVFMSGRRFDADEAVALGLLARAVDVEELDAAIEAEIKPYLGAAPEAVGRAKALARSLGPRIDDDVMQETAKRLADCWESEEAQEGISAFFEKRKPAWVS